MNIAVIGCGLIGEKRLNALKNHKLLFAVDTDILLPDDNTFLSFEPDLQCDDLGDSLYKECYSVICHTGILYNFMHLQIPIEAKS